MTEENAVHACHTCGFMWLHGQHGGHDCTSRLREALEALYKAVGELPAAKADQAINRAYSKASDVMEPDTFRERFMRSGGKA